MLRAKVLTAVAVLLAAALATPAALAGSSSGPSPAKIRAAVSRARHSKDLWATVNVCGPHRAPRTIGVRAQMPALGFPAQLSIEIQIEYWKPSRQRFVPVANPIAHATVPLGTVTAGLEQGGESFAFHPHPGAYLRATVTFRYRRQGRLLLAQTRPTTGGHPGADHGIPAHYSAATCRIH